MKSIIRDKYERSFKYLMRPCVGCWKTAAPAYVEVMKGLLQQTRPASGVRHAGFALRAISSLLRICACPSASICQQIPCRMSLGICTATLDVKRNKKWQRSLGERRIDIVVNTGRLDVPIYRLAREQGVW